MTLGMTPDSAVDNRLLRLMAAAEQGTASPIISVFTPSWMFRGQLMSSYWFLETTRRHRQEGVEGSREFKKAGATERSALSAAAESVMSVLGPPEGTELTALNLTYVTASSPDGTTMLIPALRVPVSAVIAWSVVDFNLPKQAGGGTGMAAGVVVPLG
jgi:hypothetical protein